MKIRIKYTSFFLTLCSIVYQSQANNATATNDSIILGNCTKKIVNYETIYNEDQIGGSALYYPESTMQMFKECQITNIYLGISNYKQVESLQIFISHQLEGPYDYVESVTPTNENWNKVLLSKPFKLDGSPIYIGYTIKGRMLGYSDSKEVNEEWINQRNNKWIKYTSNYSAALYAVVEGGDKLPKYNVRVKKVKMPSYSITNTPIPFSGKISNLGTEPVNSLEFTYQVGEKQYKEVLDNIDIPSQAEITFQTNGLILNEEKDANLTLSVTAVNGKPDLDITDNSSQTIKLLCRNQFTARKVLLEVFTSERCNNCPAAHDMLAKTLEGNKNVIELTHHSGYYDDPFTISASKDYEWFYSDYFYAPAHMLDRYNMSDNFINGYTVETPIVNTKEQIFKAGLSEAMTVPAFTTINLSVKRMEDTQRTVQIHVDGKNILLVPESENCRLTIFLTEDSIYTNRQEGASKGFYHRHTARMCVTNSWGDPISTDEYDADYQVEIPDNWNIDQMNVIAFVHHYDVNDHNNCRIYNAESISFKSLFPSGLNQVNAETFPIIQKKNSLILPEGYSTLKLYTTEGRCLLNDSESKEYVSLDKFPKGVYILYANLGTKQRILKVNL